MNRLKIINAGQACIHPFKNPAFIFVEHKMLYWLIEKINLYLVTRPGRTTLETHYLRQIIFFPSFPMLSLIGKRTTTRRQTVAIKLSFRFLGVLVQFAIRNTSSWQLFGCKLSQFLNAKQRWRIQRGDIVPCILKLDTNGGERWAALHWRKSHQNLSDRRLWMNSDARSRNNSWRIKKWSQVVHV
jgi:hypothetical protein